MKTFVFASIITALIFMPLSLEARTAKYPLNTCIVSDNTLGSMGKVIVKKHEGKEVKFCCKPCVKKFDKDPAKFLKRLK